MFWRLVVTDNQSRMIDALRAVSPEYHGKYLEVRREVQNWLSYIPATFPHYTRHTIEHSDAIIREISNMVWPDKGRPAIDLSGTELYILACGALLHDAGMVASEAEKLLLLQSDEWKRWIEDGDRAIQWQAAQAIRVEGGAPADVRHFHADVQCRRIISEFVRTNHHLRAGKLIAENELPLGRLAFGDAQLRRTIADVCIAHGLGRDALEDADRFPDRRDIRGEKANVRLLAILMRLGDLLDVSNDRACPLLLNAACPLPSDSVVHWSQYRCISHKMVAPDRIEISAECSNQEEHRSLQDWFQWLVDEVGAASRIAQTFRRHQDWRPPVATITGPSRTIKIQPAEGASYRAVNWRFELDQAEIYKRLIADIYESESDFIRELMQNGLDAMRCRMFAEIQEAGKPLPALTCDAAEEFRNRYRLKVGVDLRTERDAQGHPVSRQYLWIEDDGLGMDLEVVQKYLLQVGRSFYRSNEFSSRFTFSPSSRFGIGFLSVFAASSHITIDSFKPTSRSAVSGPIRITLTGVRNYILVETGSRRVSGTRIEMRLNHPLRPGYLTNFVKRICRFVEYEIEVHEGPAVSTITQETSAEFVDEVADVTGQERRFEIKAFPIESAGVRGSIFIFSHVTERGEDWTNWRYAKGRYLEVAPTATIPDLPDSIACFHGILVSQNSSEYRAFSTRADFRRPEDVPTASRSQWSVHSSSHDPVIESALQRALHAHLETSPFANGPDGWVYRQRLANIFQMPTFWRSIPATMLVDGVGGRRLESIDNIISAPVIISVMRRDDAEFGNYGRSSTRLKWEDAEVPKLGDVVIYDWVAASLQGDFRRMLFWGRNCQATMGENVFALRWTRQERARPFRFLWSSGDVIPTTGLPSTTICTLIHKAGAHAPGLLLNTEHLLVKWLLESVAAVEGFDQAPDRTRPFSRLAGLLVDAAARWPRKQVPAINSFLAKWREQASAWPALAALPLDEVHEKNFSLPFDETRRHEFVLNEMRERQNNGED